jgi:hypothetical protein
MKFDELVSMICVDCVVLGAAIYLLLSQNIIGADPMTIGIVVAGLSMVSKPFVIYVSGLLSGTLTLFDS